MATFHILNGDSLFQCWPQEIDGNVIIMRECLIDGDVRGEIGGDDLTDFYHNRANYLSSYDEIDGNDYFQLSAQQIDKIRKIPKNATIYCWFEHDLFCQTNFWFVIRLLSKYHQHTHVSLVQPNTGNEYSFAHMNNQELIEAFNNGYLLSQQVRETLSKLWDAYQQYRLSEMLALAENLPTELSFVIDAVNAQIAREPDKEGLGYPERQLLTIMRELKSQDFPTVFKAFTHRAGIYGFGDLQVKRMFDDVVKQYRNDKK